MERNEETDRSNEDTGTGRFYECVFCKRGFTTAQALGGHMNIHRKHRAKRKPNSPKFDADYYATLRGHPAIQTFPINNYQSFAPPAAASGWGFRPPISDGFCGQSPQIVEEDWRRNLNLQIGPSSEHKREDGSEAGSAQNISPVHVTEKEEWLILITSLAVEGISAIFEQLAYHLLGFLMAFLGLFICVAELFYRARTERVSVEWIGKIPFLFSHYPNYKPFGTTVQYFGLLAAIWQCLHASFGYFYARKNSENPIKMTLTMFLFCTCLIVSQVINKCSRR